GGELVPGAELRTPVVFLVRTPEMPLRLAWTVVLHQPIQFGPDGVFRSDALERAIAPGGRLSGAIEALRRLVEEPRAPAVDIVISPILLLELDRMRHGYQVADG